MLQMLVWDRSRSLTGSETWATHVDDGVQEALDQICSREGSCCARGEHFVPKCVEYL